MIMIEFQVRDSQGSGSPPTPNPDMQGYAVRLSSFITHLGVAVLMSWSKKSPRHYYSTMLTQMALIIVGTLVRSNYLSIADANFAIIQTRSPVCVYIFLLVIPRLLFHDSAWKGKQEDAQQPREMRTPNNSSISPLASSESTGGSIIIYLKAVLSSAVQPFCSNSKLRQDQIVAGLAILICLALNLIRQFNKTMYSGTTSKGSLANSLPGVPGKRQICIWLALALCSAGMYSLVLHRHGFVRRNLMHHLAGNRKVKFKSFPLRMQILWGFCAAWFTVMKLHPWLPFLYAVVMFINWSIEMVIWRIEANYSFTFGQFVAISPAVFVLYQCFKLCISRRHEIAALPYRFVLDVIWLISGKGKPWTELELELVLKNAWDTFPPDQLQEAVITKQLLGHSTMAKRRSSNVKAKSASRLTKFKEADIGEARPPYSQYIR